MGRVTAVVCAAFDTATEAAILGVRERIRAAGVALPDTPPHRPHLSLSAARVERDELARVLEAAAGVAAQHAPVPIALTEVGRFGRAGALWLGPGRNAGLPRLQRDVYRTLKHAGWEPAFGVRSAPNLWVAHCTLATRIPKPLLRALQAELETGYEPIRGRVDALATILVGGRGDVGRVTLSG